MKILRTAVYAMLLVPALALAEDSTAGAAGDSAPAPGDVVAQAAAPAAATAAPAGQPAATAKTTADAKKAEQPGGALANAVQARTPEDQARQSGFQMSVGLNHDLGVGTFVDPRYYAYLGATLAVQGRYLFGIGSKRVVASATGRLAYEYTMPDGAETGRRYAFAPISFGASMPAVFVDKEVTGISLTPSLRFNIPTSQEAWGSGQITTLAVGLVASRTIKGVNVQLGLSGSRGFFNSPTNALRPSNPDERDAYGNLIFLKRPDEVAAAVNGNNLAWTAGFNLSVLWFATDSLGFYASYGLSKRWNQAAGTDPQYDPKAVTANGDPAARPTTEMGQADTMSAAIGASYQMNEHYSLDVSLSNSEAPLTATGQVRFPFFGFGHLANNSTAISFSITAAY